MHRLFILSSFLLLISGSISIAAESTDLEKLQGLWVVESGSEGGKPRDLKSRVEFEFSKTKLLLREQKAIASATLTPDKAIEDRVFEVGFTIDEKAQPKHIDVTIQEKIVLLGIYKFKNDKLIYCQSSPGKPRPTEFTSTKENSHRLVTLKRAKKK